VPGALLDKLAVEHGSYETLFSRRAMKYKSMGLKDQKLSEKDYKRLITEEYTFLKRPVFVANSWTIKGSFMKISGNDLEEVVVVQESSQASM